MPFQSPYASPNAIPPRTSSTGIANGARHNIPVLRPLSEVDWMSKKSKLFHDSPSTTPQHSFSHNDMRHDKSYTATAAAMQPAPPEPPTNIGDELIYGHRTRWTDEKESILTGPYDYLVGHPGKDIRSQCIAAFNKWLKVPGERLETITRVVGMLHTASLLYALLHLTNNVLFLLLICLQIALTMSKTARSYAAAYLSRIVYSVSHRRLTRQTTCTSRRCRS